MLHHGNKKLRNFLRDRRKSGLTVAVVTSDKAFVERVEQMVERAGGNRPLAEQLGVTDSAIRSWLAGSKPFDSTLIKVHKKSGVSPRWIRDGVGDAETELDKIKLAPPRGSREISHEMLHELEERMPREEPDSDRQSLHARTDREMSGPRGALIAAMKTAGMNAAELAKQMRYPAGPIQAVIERGSRITQPMAERIAKIFPELDAEYLMGGSDTPKIEDESGRYATHGARPNVVTPRGMRARVIPFIAFTRAGASVNYEDDTYEHEGVTVFNVKDPQAYATQIRGDSMEPRIKEGDIIIVIPNATPRNGDIVIARLKDGDVMCKVYHSKQSGEIVVLSSYNPVHPPIEVNRDEVERIQPVHSVIQTLRRD